MRGEGGEDMTAHLPCSIPRRAGFSTTLYGERGGGRGGGKHRPGSSSSSSGGSGKLY